jgi:hypothetical protein
MFFTSSQGGDFSEENGKSTARSSDPFSYAAIFFIVIHRLVTHQLQ